MSERIRELENLDASVTISEICDRMQHYAGRLFQHLSRDYGVGMVGITQQMGDLADFEFTLQPSHDEESRATRIAGISMLNPNSVTVEYADLDALIPNPMTRTALQDGWFGYDKELMKILPGEIEGRLENIARKICFGANPNGFAEDPELNQQFYQDFLKRSGRRDPLADWERRDAAEQAEIERQKAADAHRFDYLNDPDFRG